MRGNLVITIGRQCGSGGKMIGQKIAEKLGVKCYDKELLTRAAKKAVYVRSFLKPMMRNQPAAFYILWLWIPILWVIPHSAYMDMPINHKIFLAQFDTIKKLADEESCVIVGRCADYALADYPNTVSVFITGNDEDKLKSIKESVHVDDAKAKDIMVKTDKKRSSYYNYYSSKKWGDSRSYDMCINSSVLGPEGTADMIIAFAKAKEAQNQK